MSSIVFTDNRTVVPASWLNDVNTLTYTTFANGNIVLASGKTISTTGGNTPILTGITTPIIDSGTTGSLSLKTNNGTLGLQLLDATGPTTNLGIQSGTGNANIYLQGATNSGLFIITKGTGSFNFLTGAINDSGGSPALQLQVLHTASSTRNITVTGSNGGNPTLGVTGGKLAITPTIGLIGGITTAGILGVPVIVASNRLTGQTTSLASVATFTVGASDASFEVSANVNITSSTSFNFNTQVQFTDETNASRTLTLNLSTTGGAFQNALSNTLGTGTFSGLPVHIRAKAGTTITIITSGSFTTVTYNIEAIIKQTA